MKVVGAEMDAFGKKKTPRETKSHTLNVWYNVDLHFTIEMGQMYENIPCIERLGTVLSPQKKPSQKRRKLSTIVHGGHGAS